MTLLNTRRRSFVLRGLIAWGVGCAMFAAWNRSDAREVSEEFLEVEESLSVDESFSEGRSLMDEVLPPGDESADGSHFVDPDSEPVGQLDPLMDGGGPVHGILPQEAAEILALYEAWGGVDRSHRKLVNRAARDTTTSPGPDNVV